MFAVPAVSVADHGRGWGGAARSGVAWGAGHRGVAGRCGHGGGRAWGRGEALGQQTSGARHGLSHDGFVPVRRGRLHRGGDEGHRFVVGVGLLGRGVVGADLLGDHPGPQAVGSRRAGGGVRAGRRTGGDTVDAGCVAAWAAACGHRRIRRGPARQQGERRPVRLRRLRSGSFGVPEGAGGGAGRVRHARVPGRRTRRLLGRGEDPRAAALPAVATR
jgi:hypothetical protein